MPELRFSDLARAIQKQDRWRKEVDISGFYGHTGERLPKVLVQINTKGEDIEAIVAAHEAVARFADKAPSAKDAAKSDEDITSDIKTIEALWRAYRDANDPSETAFASPEWMRDTFDTDQLAYLLNIYLACRRERGPLPPEVSPGWIESVREAVADMPVDQLSAVQFGAFSREYLVDFITAALRQWSDERKAHERETKAPVVEG